MYKFLILTASMALSACTASQEAMVFSAIDTTCHVATEAEAADPAFVAHNGKVIAGQSVLCGTAAALTASP